MLDLLSSYAAFPAHNVYPLLLPDQHLVVYPSADLVVISDAQSLSLRRALSFSEPFPKQTGAISCLAVDSGMKLIVAAVDACIAVWSLSEVQSGRWRIHSTLALLDGRAVTCLGCKSGLLAVGTEACISVYTLILENDLPTWSMKWSSSTPVPPSFIQFSPSLMFMVTSTKEDNIVRTYSTTSGRLVQSIPHPRPLTSVAWRHTDTAYRDDLILYTVTKDATLRIFIPVLDSPYRLQLHASLDLYSALPVTMASNYSRDTSSSVFWLDKDVIKSVSQVGSGLLEAIPKDIDNAPGRRLHEIVNESWDLFLRVFEDGSVVVSAVLNIDRRPPTLLKHFTLQQSLPGIFSNLPLYLHVLPSQDPSFATLVTSPPLSSFQLFPLAFFDAQQDGLQSKAQLLDRVPDEEVPISKFIRTLDGRGVGTIRTNGCGEAWKAVGNGKDLERTVKWNTADFVVVLEGGNLCATYSRQDNIFTLHSDPIQSLALPSLESLFTMPSASGEEYIIGITLTSSVVQIRLDKETGILSLQSDTPLPLPNPPERILPVDPMAWGQGYSWAKHDVLLSISSAGELAFWITDGANGSEVWKCTGMVRTGRTKIKRARCSSAKKTALIIHEDNAEELMIWDSQESEFASGLEYQRRDKEPINDLDWTSTPDNQSILAVGYFHRVELLYERRMTYFDEGPGWAVCWTIDTSLITSLPISDSVWLTDGSLLVGIGNQMLLYAEHAKAQPAQETLFEYVDSQNRPLKDYHPQMLLQCLLWEKVELVKEIIVKLANYLEYDEHHDFKNPWNPISVERFLYKNNQTSFHKKHKQQYTGLFDTIQESDDSESGFSRALVLRLLKTLEERPLPDLTPNEHSHLLVLIQATLEIDEQRLALDANGLRYLTSIRSFFILNDRAKSSASSAVNGHSTRTGLRERLRYRDMVWAFHSESQGLLLTASTAAFNNKIRWSDAKAMGLPIWLKSIETLRSQLEIIARNEYMSGDVRDPTTCSLFYFALGKVKLVHGLWRQASWHSEYAMTLKFLSNDFSDPRWRTAALKNAFALLSKRRFAYAAAFFLLGDSLKDAVNVCLKQLGDFQLALALARVVEQRNDGPVLTDILSKTVLPIAIREGNRWLGSWALWLLHRRDLSVKILLTPLQDIADSLQIIVEEIGEPHYDDPSLALLFSQLRSKTLQAAKGTSEISGRLEFNFVLQMARVFCRMGCDVLALDLVRSWSFERPSAIVPNRSPIVAPLPIPTARRPGFSMGPAMRRRSSMMIDMDILSLPSTRTESPHENKSSIPEEKLTTEDDLLARKAGLGQLMKTAKMDVQVPEFDMSAFF